MISPLQVIQKNIVEYGHHIYLVPGVTAPRFAYTIGLSDTLGAELVFAGGASYTAKEVRQIVNDIATQLRSNPEFSAKIEIAKLGVFTFEKVNDSWIQSLLLGALDYYKDRVISAYQILPDKCHGTIDIPDLRRPWCAASEPAWRWYYEEWPFPIPRKSVAVTNLEALRGRRITEAARWEDDQWEMFAGPGPDVVREDVRVVPLAILLGVDASLQSVVSLELGKAIRRDEKDGAWQLWEKK